MTKRAQSIVKIEIMPDGKWKIAGQGGQHLLLIPNDKVPEHVRAGMAHDTTAFFVAKWNRSRAQWFVGSRTAWGW